MNAFRWFSQQHRQVVKDEYPGASVIEVAKALGCKWRQLSECEKKKCKGGGHCLSEVSYCGCEEDEDDDGEEEEDCEGEEFCADLFSDCASTGCPRVLNNQAGSLSKQLGLQPNVAVLPDDAINNRPIF